VLVLVVDVGASKETPVVKIGESSGLPGAVERSIPVFKSDSPAASLVGERRGEEEVDSSTLSVSSTLMIVAWCGVGGAEGAAGLTGGNGKRDFLSSRGAEDTTVDIVILDAGTWISATIGLGFTSAVMRTVIGARDLEGSPLITPA